MIKLTGTITNYNRLNLRGKIKFVFGKAAKGNPKFYTVSFHADQIVNPDFGLIAKGLRVEFYIAFSKKDQDFRGTAKMITVIYRSHKLTSIYNNYDVMNAFIDEEEDWDYQEAKKAQLLEENKSLISLPRNLESIALTLFDNKIKLVSLLPDGEYKYLDEKRTYHNIVYPSLFEEYLLEQQIEEFEDMINSARTSENDLQKFMERNPKFLLTDQYVSAHPHVNLVNQDNDVLIPDFVLQPSNQNAFCDILDLKLPTERIFIMKDNRERFSASVSEAAAQLRNYSKFFDERVNRENFQNRYPHLKVYKPKMVVVIGRRDYRNPIAQQEIMADNPYLILKNYDDLLDHIKNAKKLLENRNNLFR